MIKKVEDAQPGSVPADAKTIEIAFDKIDRPSGLDSAFEQGSRYVDEKVYHTGEHLRTIIENDLHFNYKTDGYKNHVDVELFPKGEDSAFMFIDQQPDFMPYPETDPYKTNVDPQYFRRHEDIWPHHCEAGTSETIEEGKISDLPSDVLEVLTAHKDIAKSNLAKPAKGKGDEPAPTDKGRG